MTQPRLIRASDFCRRRRVTSESSCDNFVDNDGSSSFCASKDFSRCHELQQKLDYQHQMAAREFLQKHCWRPCSSSSSTTNHIISEGGDNIITDSTRRSNNGNNNKKNSNNNGVLNGTTTGETAANDEEATTTTAKT